MRKTAASLCQLSFRFDGTLMRYFGPRRMAKTIAESYFVASAFHRIAGLSVMIPSTPAARS